MDEDHRRHHLYRYIIVIVFLGGIFISSERAGQSESDLIAIGQIALYNQERAPVEEVFLDNIDYPIIKNVETEPIGENIQAQQDLGLHLPMPSVLHGIYLTSWSAGSQQTMDRIYKLIDSTSVNAVVIDIKDATGRISYQPLDPELLTLGVGTNRIRNLSKVISSLHERNIYIIGRIAVFQDPFYAKLHPEDAFVDNRTGGIWHDYKGIAWLRPDSQNVWDYHVRIASDAYMQGFDEINMDYVRFPSDGEISYIDKSTQIQTKADTIRSFFQYIDPLLRGQGMVLSADLFGLTMSANDDLGIGQKLEYIAPYVDIVAPMVYPSHFGSGSYGIAKPAENPYEVIRHSMSYGIKKLAVIGIGVEKLRPWLQDFDLGAIYSPTMVADQIRASEELGLKSWMLWDPRNSYTQEVLVRDFLDTSL